MTDNEGLVHKETQTIDEEFVYGLAEISFRNEAIRNNLSSLGFEQFFPPDTGYLRDTVPPNMTDIQRSLWIKDQDARKLEYFAQRSDVEILQHTEQREKYDQVVDYMKPKVIESLGILAQGKFGLTDVFRLRLNGEQVSASKLIEVMRSYGIDIEEHPENDIGFDGKGNHGESRFRNGKWNVKLNSVALSNPSEIFHELIAIECFDKIMNLKPSLQQAVKSIPNQLAVLLIEGKSIKESSARARYITQHMLNIPLLEGYYDIISRFDRDSDFVKGFVSLLNQEIQQ